MAPITKPTKSTKPLKPYRRGETLGKASRAGKSKGSRPTPANKPTQEKLVPAPSVFDDEEEDEEDEGEDEELDEEGTEEGENAAPAPVVKPVKRKKGKKFIETKVRLSEWRSLCDGGADFGEAGTGRHDGPDIPDYRPEGDP